MFVAFSPPGNAPQANAKEIISAMCLPRPLFLLVSCRVTKEEFYYISRGPRHPFPSLSFGLDPENERVFLSEGFQMKWTNRPILPTHMGKANRPSSPPQGRANLPPSPFPPPSKKGLPREAPDWSRR
ncbi:hypothetical protein BaRGS_00030555 [Batillaria attramentaria]|uniref:Uncharacterized protein n=1 Tax=Batillaria attramentaria TaxID=370345 RepID=A0ABD0JU38_9CAEN